jgi:hypothetical protein
MLIVIVDIQPAANSLKTSSPGLCAFPFCEIMIVWDGYRGYASYC